MAPDTLTIPTGDSATIQAQAVNGSAVSIDASTAGVSPRHPTRVIQGQLEVELP